ATGTRLRDRMERLTADVDDLLSGMKLVKAFGREDAAIERFKVSTKGTLSEQLGFVEARSWTQVFAQTAGAITLALFVFLASEWLHIPASEYLVMILLFSRLLPRVSTLQESWQFIRHIRPSLEAIQRTLEELGTRREVPVTTGSRPFRLQQEIEFRDVVFRYAPDVEPALREINLRIPAGKITAILGPSGSGKTTLADLIAGLMSPEAGVITVDDSPLSADLVVNWRRCVGYVPQESFLFHDTIRANLLWARPGADPEELWEALRLARADQFVARLPQGLDTIVRDRGGRLSGGERQRVALARALLIRPTLLLLDEATSEVDPQSQEEILRTVRGLRGRMTIVIIAHHAPVEGLADQILVLDQGHVERRRFEATEVGIAGSEVPDDRRSRSG
ncbi:MAG: ABC transporter ATP-binding protein, partial [Acidobacteriota bacterium]